VRTERIEEQVDVLDHLPADVSAAWLRHGQGMVARGEVWRCETSGDDRFDSASEQFSRLARAADVRDDVQVRGSGLVACGTFSYAASSPRPSHLMVPAAILGVYDGEAFLTTLTVREPASADARTRADADDSLPPLARDANGQPEWRPLFPGTPERPGAHLEIHPDHSPEEYQALVSAAVDRIRAGEAGKVVLSESMSITSDHPAVPAVLLRRLARAYPTTWTYHLGDVIGASPEMLADTRDRRVFSRVLAGSRPVADGAELDERDRTAFRHDAKERSEHAYAIDSVIESLEPLTATLNRPAEPYVLRLPGIEHLASDVSGLLREGSTSLEVAGALHPSAAVSGTPRKTADAVIADLEPRDRGGYASPVGWMDARGDGQWAIALRMAHLDVNGGLRLQAGGGLVADSDPVAEHAEVLAKCRPLLKAIRGD
jgi:menaquinone-specific isochorismate synthase